ncbi:MAG: hypothetical protein HKN62_13540 [Phycisphaerales bacterium]|nr:hypothetical protein [Phycisphaerales bacterium]
MYEFFKNLDRRWVFLLMFLAVALPILFQAQFPEKASGLATAVFEKLEALDEGDRVLLAFDFDPASEGELGPMATSFVRHCCEKKLKMYFMALWPVGEQMITDNINKVIRADFPELVEHVDYVNLGFKAGNEGVIKVVITDLRQLYTTDAAGTSLEDIPMMQGVENIQQMDLMCNVSAGYPGTKEWVQYAVTRYPDEITLVAGCTGVQAPLLYPYIPQQLPGLLAAIKGAAEYENLVLDKYGQNILVPDEDGEMIIPGKYTEGKRRMGPQLIAHILMVLLIIAGNIIYFVGRTREGR